MQWNLCIVDTIGTNLHVHVSVLIIEVSLFQSVLIREAPLYTYMYMYMYTYMYMYMYIHVHPGAHEKTLRTIPVCLYSV